MPEERPDTRRRHALCFRDLLIKADSQYLKGGDEAIAAMRLFDRTWADASMAQKWADQRDDHEAQRFRIEFPYQSGHLLGFRRPGKDQIAWWEPALRAARALGDRPAEAAALDHLAYAQLSLGHSHKALDLGKQALEMYREVGERSGEVSALQQHGLPRLTWTWTNRPST